MAIDLDGDRETSRTAGALFVDLDGCLVATDLLWESVFQLLRRQPWCVFLFPWWLLRGRAALKGEVARRVVPAPEDLPYDDALLDLIRARKAEGAHVVLATASPRDWAAVIGDHLGLFDAVLATRAGANLKGRGKLTAIQAYCQDHGISEFAYVGDCGADLPIWSAANAAYIVSPTRGLLRKLRALGRPVHSLGADRRPLAALARALRPHQWAKNVLVFVPLITSQRLFVLADFAAALVAFVAFSLCASAIYIVNDLVDLAADRAHPEKKRRPWASGALPLAWGPPLSLALLLGAFTIAALALPWAFVAVLGSYLVLTSAYSFGIKNRLMADVLLLAGLYTIRIFAGGVATGMMISEWLIGFSMFLFLSLAFVKRFIELDRLAMADTSASPRGRNYRSSDLELIATVGPTSGYLAVLVLALYIQSDEVQQLYRTPDLLWPVCLALIYWISRVWFLARRREMPSDPVVFALGDHNSLVLGALVALCLIAAALLPT